jgi:hypothetical protein
MEPGLVALAIRRRRKIAEAREPNLKSHVYRAASIPPMNPSESAHATIPADPAWDEAFLRVESYLRAYGLESRVLLNRIALEIVQEARARNLGGEDGDPVTLALEVTHARIGEWFARAGRDLDWANERTRSQGRLSLIVADFPGRWGNHFLSAEPVPAELAGAMSGFDMLPGPELRLSNMAPEPLEFGLESGDSRLPGGRFRVPARAAVSWLLIFGFFGAAWAASH